MGPGALLLLALGTQVGGAVAAGECRDGQLSVIATVRELLDRGDDDVARKAVAALPPERSSCAPLELTRLAVAGWFEARALAPAGAPADRLGPIKAMLEALAQLKADTTIPPQQREVFGIEVEYAETVLHAAIAAAQDERPEMELMLGHARDLVQRLAQRGSRAAWPRPFNFVAGELWFEVDRYDEARAAYERAAQADPTPAALVGLARAQARLGRYDLACVTFKRVKDAGASLREAAKADFARCR